MTVSVWVSVWVTVLVLVLTEVLGVVVVVVVVVVGSVVVVVVVGVGSAVVVAVAVSVTVAGGTTAGADVVVSGVSDVVVVWSDVESPVMALARPKTTRAIRSAPAAPKDTSATGFRYQGVAASASVGDWSYSP